MFLVTLPHKNIYVFCRAPRAVTASRLAERGRTSCHLIKSKSSESVRGRGNARERSERWRDVGTLGMHPHTRTNTSVMFVSERLLVCNLLRIIVVQQ